MRPPSESSPDFVIHGGGDSFADKQRQLSELLSRAAKDCNKEQNTSGLSESDEDQLRNKRSGPLRMVPFARQNRKEMLKYRGRESLFKRPQGPAPLAARKAIADYHKNPHKWVKYSLDDVKSDQMSDKSNAQAAFSFLRELRARRSREGCKEPEEESMDTSEPEPDAQGVPTQKCSLTTRIPFRKTLEKKVEQPGTAIEVEREEKPIFRRSTIILPEYVVGQKKEKKIRKKLVGKVDRSKQMKLSHLEEIDE